MSFDVSVIDVAMLIAILVLFTLYLTSSPKEDSAKKHILKKLTLPNKTKPQETNNPSPDEKTDCPHHLGYLKTCKEKGIPEECQGCNQLIKCLTSEE